MHQTPQDLNNWLWKSQMILALTELAICHGRVYLFLFSVLESLSLDMIRWLVT
jgi:hypothetical protein